MIRVSIIGPTQVWLNDELVSLPTAKDRAVIALLATSELRATTPAELISALWQGPEVKARHSFNQSVSTLRKTLTPQALRRDEVSLQLGAEVCADFSAYIDLVRRGALDEARALLRGPLLQDLSLIGSDDLDEIVEQVRVKFERRVNEAALIALEDAASSGDWHKLANLTQHIVENHQPSPDVGFYALLAAAVEDGPLGMRSVVERLQNLHHPDIVDRLASRAFRVAKLLRYNGADTRVRPSVVGRKQIVAEFERMLDEAVRGSGSTLQIVGDPGIGKSTLARHFAYRSALRGAAVLMIEGRYAERQIGGAGLRRLVSNPYVQSFRNQMTAAARRDLRRMTGIVAEKGLECPDPNASHADRLVEIVTALVARAAERRPTVIIVDDLSWVDPTTRHCLHEVGALGKRLPLLLVFTTRPEREAGMQGSGAGPHKRTLVLKPFDLKEVAEYCSRVGVKENPTFLLFQTGGHPLLLSEVTRGVNENAGSLTVDRYLQDTTDGLTTTEKLLLQAASVIAHPTAPNTIAAVAGLPFGEAALALDTLVEKGLVRNNGGEFAIGHDLLREHLLKSIGRATQELLHIRAGRCLRRLGAPLAVVASHYLQSTHSQIGGKLALRAARQSERKRAFREAAELYSSALAHMKSSSKRAEVAYRVGILCSTTENVDHGISILREHADAFTSCRGFLARGELIRLALENQSGLIHNVNALRSVSEPHLSECKDQGYWRDYLRGIQTILRCADLNADEDAVRDVIPRLTDLVNECPDLTVRADAMRFAGHLTSRYVNSEAGLELATSAVEISKTLDAHAHALALSTLAAVAVDAGDLRMGDQASREGFAVAQAAGHVHQCLSICNNWGVALFELGRFDEAGRKFAYVIDSAGSSHRALVGAALSNWAWLCLENNDWQSAQQYARSAMDYSNVFVTIAVVSRAVLGFAALEQGRLSEAFEMSDAVTQIQPRFSGSDLSLAYMLRSRVAKLRGNDQSAKQLLTDAMNMYSTRHRLARLRVELAFAKLVAVENPTLAEEMFSRVREAARSIQAARLDENARRATARVKRGGQLGS